MTIKFHLLLIGQVELQIMLGFLGVLLKDGDFDGLNLTVLEKVGFLVYLALGVRCWVIRLLGVRYWVGWWFAILRSAQYDG